MRRPQKEPWCNQITVSTVCNPLGVSAPVCDQSAPFCLPPRAASNALQLAPLLPTCRSRMAQWTSNVLGHSSRGGPCALKPTSLLTALFRLVWQHPKIEPLRNTSLGLYPCKMRNSGGRVQLKCDGIRWLTEGEVKGGNRRMECVATLHKHAET